MGDMAKKRPLKLCPRLMGSSFEDFHLYLRLSPIFD
jgi:hypothetical protein